MTPAEWIPVLAVVLTGTLASGCIGRVRSSHRDLLAAIGLFLAAASVGLGLAAQVWAAVCLDITRTTP